MSKRLDNLVSINQLKREEPDQAEIDVLVARARARLHDAARAELSIESRFDLAYAATHGLALAALRFHGYRSENRYTVFQTLQDTVGLPPDEWRILDVAHRKRNVFEYGGVVAIEETLVAEMIEIGRELERRVGGLGRPS